MYFLFFPVTLVHIFPKDRKYTYTNNKKMTATSLIRIAFKSRFIYSG